jgi:hypothetical protein
MLVTLALLSLIQAQSILPSCKSGAPCSTVYKIGYQQSNYFWDFQCYAYAGHDGSFSTNLTSVQIFSNHGNNALRTEYITYSYTPQSAAIPKTAKLSFTVNSLSGNAPTLAVSPTNYAMSFRPANQPNYYIYREFPHDYNSGPNGCTAQPWSSDKFRASHKLVKGLNTLDITDVLVGYLNSLNGTVSQWNLIFSLPYYMIANTLLVNIESPTLTYTQ